ncbi:glycosyltransferase family 2 protein [Leptolyngbya sp. NIES-2104]|uniref:glycosyltransferase family 2 protein n=1 Tax=Leptolyngbya sp. NIES-2104 TaxID=1552121 RepID=UPI0006EC51D9|nr:glycosyltransferase [Leptolyngbya sp. NIES-2104]GAP98746.1 glycosyltransferase [Leptolyngbya sp. NIES-2104]
MNQSPLVSILINNYNYEQYVSQAIDSALNQTYDRVEVVVVDDGSKDQSRDAIAKYGDRIVSVFKPNGGQGSAFNAGFAASHGDLICFLDADDYCFPEKAAQIVEAFEKYPDSGWMFHRLKRVDAVGEALPPNHEMKDFGAFDFRSSIQTGQPVRPIFPATSGLCFRREILQQTLPMPESLRISADNFLRLSAIHLAPGLLLAAELAVHRIHGSNSYESRKDTAYLHAETNIQTSYHLRKRFPQTKAFTDQLFSHSYGQIAGRSGFDRLAQIPESNGYLKEFFSLKSWLSCSPKIFYNYAKSFLNRS